MYNKNLFLFLLIIFIPLIIYSGAISFNFLNWDDDIHVYKNPAFESETPLKDIWTTFKTTSYLPIAHSFFYLQWKISHSPHLFHTINVILHLINLLLIFILLQKLKIETATAFFITLIYAIHPMRVEAVAWITEQKGLIAGIFIWLAFLSYINYVQKRSFAFLCLSALFYVFALFSKQTTFPLFFIVLAFRYFILRDKGFKKYLPELLILGSIGFGIMSVHWLRESRHFINSAAYYMPFSHRILVFFKSFIYYPLKTIIPVNLCPIYPRWQFFQDFTGDFLPVIAVISLTLLIVYYYRRFRTDFANWLIFCYISYFFSILPVSGIFTMPYMNTTFIADRYSYFPAIFITIIFVLTLTQYFKKYARAILKIFSFICILSSYLYLPIWKEPDIFWNYTISKNPDADTGYTNLSYYYIHKEEQNTENLMKAMSLAQKAIELNPDNSIGYYNYGTCLMKSGKLKDAEEYFRKSLILKPDYADVWNDLGYLMEIQGKTKDAIECYNKALQFNPNHKVAHFNLERLLSNTKPLDKASS